MKINAQVKMSMVLISLMFLVVSFQNCAGTTVTNPYNDDPQLSIGEGASQLDSVIISDNLTETKSDGFSALSLCVDKIEFQSVSTSTTTVYTLDQTFEFSLLSGSVDVNPPLPSSPVVNAAKFYIVDACSSLVSAGLTVVTTGYSTTQSLEFYVPVTVEENGYYHFDFKGLADALLNATSNADLENILLSRDQSTLPLITTYTNEKPPRGE